MSKIIDYLRNYQKWRRGAEDMEAPDPKELGEYLDAAITSLEKLERERDEAIELREKEMVDAIHSCHPECPRRMCVMRRELHKMKNLNWDLLDRLSKALDAVSVLQAEVETLRNVAAAAGLKTQGN